MHVIREWFHILLENAIYFENGINLKLSTILLTKLRWSREWCSPLHGGRINADWHSRTLLRTDYRGWNLTSISHDLSKQEEIHYSPSKHVLLSVCLVRENHFSEILSDYLMTRKSTVYFPSLLIQLGPLMTYMLTIDFCKDEGLIFQCC